jgi:tRNA A-37 threonylcarbamoyl transferase component Bud32
MQPALNQNQLEVLGRKGKGLRCERYRANIDHQEVELRIVNAPFVKDAAAFVQRTESIVRLSHPSLRPVCGALFMPDGRPAAVLKPVEWIPLSASCRLDSDALLTMGIELAGALSAVHAAGLAFGILDGDDIYPASPALLDPSLISLSQQTDEPRTDVRMLCLTLSEALGSGPQGKELTRILKRGQQGEFSAASLKAELEAFRQWSHDTAEALEPDWSHTVLGPWKLERILGEGSMARVYFATHVHTGQPAAVKVLKQKHVGEPEYVQRFIQEVKSIESIQNEHIVKIIDFGERILVDGHRCVYCVMEGLEGQTLAEAFSHESFGVVRSARIAQQIAWALEATHACGVVHRDIKPENIFLTSDGHTEFVKVFDFGVAKLLRPLPGLALVGTRSGVVLGTPEYMAPEQVMGRGPDARVDIYALGLVLYELLAGKPPFQWESLPRLTAEITQSLVPPLPETNTLGEEVPRELRALVLRCLEKEPNDRFAGAAELAQALEPFVHPKVLIDDVPPAVRGPFWGALAVSLVLTVWLLIQS